MDSLLDFLSYRKYDPKTSIFENQKTLGFVLRVGHFSGIDEAAKTAIRSLITNDLPVDITLQVINYASPRIGNLLDYWHKKQKSNSIFHKISSGRYEFLKNSNWQNVLGNKGKLIVRDYELYFCFSIPKIGLQSEYPSETLKLKALQDKFTQGLKSINSDSYLLNDRDLAGFLNEILNPSNDVYKQRNSNFDQDFRESFKSKQLIEMNNNRVILYDQKNQTNYYYSIFEVTGFPEYWDLSNGIDYIGGFEKGLSIPCPFYISMSFTLNSRDASQRIADKHRMIKTQQNDSKLPMFFPKMLEENNDWRYVSEMISQGERIGKIVMHVVLINTTHTCIEEQNTIYARIAENEQILQDHFVRLGFSICKVHHDCLNSFLQTLPFGIGENWQILDQLKISSKALSGSCINLMPVFADSQNYTSPLMLLVGRRGQLFFFDNFRAPLDNNGNFNMVVVGASGRGKSVWLQEYSVSLLRNGGQVVIIDDGRSFKNTCELLDGDFVDFGGGKFCLNPFSLYKIPDKHSDLKEYQENFEEPFIDLVVSMLCIIINLDKDNNKDIDVGLYRSLLTNAVIKVIKAKGQNGGFTDIRNALKADQNSDSLEIQKSVNKVIYILNSYSDDEHFARYFNGKATLDLKNKFTVFELSDLQNNEVLQSSALLTVTFLVYAKINNRNTKTALIIDEFWRMGKHPILKGPIDGFARRGRKYNLSLIVASQCMSDFDTKTSEAGAVALSQADWRIILSVDGKDDYILRDELKMNSGEIAICNSLRGIKGAYSEFMIRHRDKSWQIGRLLLDPFSAKAYSTKAEDMAAIKEMKAKGINVVQAIETLINSEADK